LRPKLARSLPTPQIGISHFAEYTHRPVVFGELLTQTWGYMTYAWYTANSSQQATELKEKRKHSRIFVCGSSSREFCFSQRRRRRRRRAIWQTNNDNWMTFELCLRSVCVLQGRGFCGHLCVWATCRNYGNESFACRLITSTKTDSFKPTTFSRTSGKSETSRRARARKQGDTKLWQDICREVRL